MALVHPCRHGTAADEQALEHGEKPHNYGDRSQEVSPGLKVTNDSGCESVHTSLRPQWSAAICAVPHSARHLSTSSRHLCLVVLLRCPSVATP